MIDDQVKVSGVWRPKSRLAVFLLIGIVSLAVGLGLLALSRYTNSQIKAAEPDWIYVTGYTQDLILARKQMADLGVSAPIVTSRFERLRTSWMRSAG